MEKSSSSIIQNIKQEFLDAMDDDFNTALAMSKIFDLVREANLILSKDTKNENDKECLYEIKDLIIEFDSFLGLLQKEEKIALICRVLDRYCLNHIEMLARYHFETSLYESIESGEYLDDQKIASIWIESRDRVYGDGIDWLPEDKWKWMIVSHNFMSRVRFYNYPYVFAQLFVYALYRVYKEQGDNFVPKLKKLLAAGSSKSPRELAASLDLDISVETFWQKGMKQAEEFINMLEDTL